MIRIDGDPEGEGPICLVVTGVHAARDVEREVPAGFRLTDDGQRLTDGSGWFFNLARIGDE